MQKDIDNRKKAQRCATRKIPEISSLSYEERLQKCGFLSLEIRRLRADLKLVSKIVKGFFKLRLISSSNFWKICV